MGLMSMMSVMAYWVGEYSGGWAWPKPQVSC